MRQVFINKLITRDLSFSAVKRFLMEFRITCLVCIVNAILLCCFSSHLRQNCAKFLFQCVFHCLIRMGRLIDRFENYGRVSILVIPQRNVWLVKTQLLQKSVAANGNFDKNLLLSWSIQLRLHNKARGSRDRYIRDGQRLDLRGFQYHIIVDATSCHRIDLDRRYMECYTLQGRLEWTYYQHFRSSMHPHIPHLLNNNGNKLIFLS